MATEGFIVIGKIVGVHGLKGTLKVFPLSDRPRRFETLRAVFVVTAAGAEQRRVARVRVREQRVLLDLDGIGSIEAAEPWVGAELALPEAEAEPLPEGHYRHYDLLGMEAYREDGRRLGVVADIRPTGASDVFVIRDGPREWLVPAAREIVVAVDVAAKRMTIRPIKGLFEDDQV